MSSMNWTCPFCGHDTVINLESIQEGDFTFDLPNASGPKRFDFRFVVCPNEKCRNFTLTASLAKLGNEHGRMTALDVEKSWGLVPPTKAKSFPTFIPKNILDDYNEACLISDLSPRAAATLARLCLQSILVDVWKVKSGTLADGFKAICDKVDPLTWDALSAISKSGKLGAHLQETNINQILDGDQKETDLLINLIELLIKDWYVAKRERQKRINQLMGMASGDDLC
jgi:hypothetical protein